RLSTEPTLSEICSDLGDEGIDTRRITTGIQDPADRHRVIKHQPRLKIGSRHPHHHAVDSRTPPRRHTLVIHAVLSAHERKLAPASVYEVLQRRLRILGFHG